MTLRFILDFANNWKAGDIVEAKPLSNGDMLVDNVARIDTVSLMKHCEIITESENKEIKSLQFIPLPLRWIPVDKKKPDVEFSYWAYDLDEEFYDCFKSDRLLVSYISKDTKETKMCVSRFSVWKYENGKQKISWDSVFFDCEEPNIPNEWGEVVAWCPLPQPYEESEDKK